MARIELKKMYPFNVQRPNGRWETTESHYFTLELETAPSKAGITPFRVSYGAKRLCERGYTDIDTALEALNENVRQTARNAGYYDEYPKTLPERMAR